MKRLSVALAILLAPFTPECQPSTNPPAVTTTAATSTTSSPPPTTVRAPRVSVPARPTPPPNTQNVFTASTLPAAPTVNGLIPAPQSSLWPSWRLNAAGVPYYAGRPSCSVVQAHEIAVQFINRGASVATAQWAVYVASREGGCNYLAVNINERTRDDSHCTFQLNARTGGPLSSAGVLGKLGWTKASVKVSLSECARAAAALWAVCGKGPWIQGDYGCRKPTS